MLVNRIGPRILASRSDIEDAAQQPSSVQADPVALPRCNRVRTRPAVGVKRGTRWTNESTRR